MPLLQHRKGRNMAEKKAFYELQFPDAFMFAATMEDEEIFRGVLERVMGIPIRAVKVIGEASMLVNPDYRGVRLDVYAEEAPELVRFLKYVDGAATAQESQSDELISKIEARIAEIKQSRGMEVRYMLFSEMLSDERKEGRQEGCDKLLQLMNAMIADGDADKLPLLSKDAGFLQEMFEKYHIEV